jgi:hypothetical protein
MAKNLGAGVHENQNAIRGVPRSTGISACGAPLVITQISPQTNAIYPD